MVRGRVVGNKIEQQTDAPLAQPLAQPLQGLVAAQAGIHGIALDGEGRAADIFVPIVA